MNGIYNNSLWDALLNHSEARDFNWMTHNLAEANKPAWCAFYQNRQILQHSRFPALVEKYYQQKIWVGVPFSTVEEVNQAVTYNRQCAHKFQQIRFLVSEIEDYGNSPHDTPYLLNTLRSASAIAAQNALPIGVYQGWTAVDNYHTIVPLCDFIFLHAYRSSDLMLQPKAMYEYCETRLEGIANATMKHDKKPMPVSIIFSCENEFGAQFFSAHPWQRALDIFMKGFHQFASAEVKQFVKISGYQIFVSKEAQGIQPFDSLTPLA